MWLEHTVVLLTTRNIYLVENFKSFLTLEDLIMNIPRNLWRYASFFIWNVNFKYTSNHPDFIQADSHMGIYWNPSQPDSS